MVLSQVGVSIGAFRSKTIRAVLLIWVPFGSPDCGITLNTTVPSPAGGEVFGGRNPAWGSSVRSPVSGLIDAKLQVTRPVLLSTPALTVTSRFWSGRRSTPPV